MASPGPQSNQNPPNGACLTGVAPSASAALDPPRLATSAEHERSRRRSAREAVPRDPVVRGAALAILVWLVGYAVFSVLVDRDTRLELAVADILYQVPAVVGAVLAVMLAARRRTPNRRFWVPFAAGAVLYCLGEGVWAFYEVVLQIEPYPSPGDFLMFAGHLLWVVAIVRGFRAPKERGSLRAALDAGVFGVAICTAGWMLLLKPQLGEGFDLATVLSVAYVLLALVLIVLGTIMVIGRRRSAPPSIILVGVGLLIGSLTESVWAYLEVRELYASGNLIDLGWQLQFLLPALGALVALRHDEGADEELVLDRDVGLPLLLAGLAILLAFFAVDPDGAGRATLPTTVLGAVVVAAVSRLVMTARDNRRIAAQLVEALAEQERLAVTDGLTGLHNRRFFESVLPLEAERSARSGEALGVIVLDLDHFKQINDSHGHAMGDRVLCETAARLQAVARAGDVLARYGGEEFVLLAPGADERTASDLAERCRGAIGNRSFSLGDGRHARITTSLGLGIWRPGGESINDVVLGADKALYAAKRAGRDRVGLASEIEEGAEEETATHRAKAPDGATQPSALERPELDGLAAVRIAPAPAS